MRHFWIVAVTSLAAVAGCAVDKTQRDRDVEQCTYGVVVPHNITRQAERRHFIDDSVAGCLRARGCERHSTELRHVRDGFRFRLRRDIRGAERIVARPLLGRGLDIPTAAVGACARRCCRAPQLVQSPRTPKRSTHALPLASDGTRTRTLGPTHQTTNHWPSSVSTEVKGPPWIGGFLRRVGYRLGSRESWRLGVALWRLRAWRR